MSKTNHEKVTRDFIANFLKPASAVVSLLLQSDLQIAVTQGEAPFTGTTAIVVTWSLPKQDDWDEEAMEAVLSTIFWMMLSIYVSGGREKKFVCDIDIKFTDEKMHKALKGLTEDEEFIQIMKEMENENRSNDNQDKGSD